jgi:hypothetical protein
VKLKERLAMKTKLILGLVSGMLLSGCATVPKTSESVRNFNAPSLTVNQQSDGRQILDSIPVESVLDHFEMIDVKGRLISYVAFTDTETGGLVFVDNKFRGTLSRRYAQAFYICRGHTMVTQNYWAGEASEWVSSLFANTQPVASVTLEFSGKSASQNIKEVSENSFLGKVKSFLSVGANPFGIINALNTARNDIEASEQFENEVKGLGSLKPGMSELSVAEVAKPEYLSFVGDGMVMAYPSHRVEYFVSGGVIKVIQYPSLHQLSGMHAAMFYAPGTQWPLCTSQRWNEAIKSM